MQTPESKTKSMPLRFSEPTTVVDVSDMPRRRSELAGKAAIVTGSTSGIGLGIARAFAEAGMNVALNGFGDRDTIEETRSELETTYGVKAAYLVADMSKPADIVRMVDEASNAFGKVDVLVNNAGILHVAAIESTPPEKWDAILSINLSSAFHTIRALLPRMKARGWGRIINVASAVGLVGSPNNSAYAASKHGTIGLTRAVALEVAEHGITVNAICPGYVLTPLVEREIRQTAKIRGTTEEQVASDFVAQAQPTRRFVTTGEIGALAMFLCTDAAASITGAAVPIDGGWTAR
jgi:3-hydroxybutyrate dehydrogenase